MTTKDQIPGLLALLEDYEYVDDNDVVVLTNSLRATFYFWGGHTKPVRDALVSCVEAYQILFGSELKWGYIEDGKQFVPYDKLPSIKKFVEPLDENDTVDWHVSSADNPDICGHFEIVTSTERGWKAGDPSMVTFVLPRTYAFDEVQQKSLLDLIALFIEKLNPFHGHAGLCATSTFEQYQYQPDEFDIATKLRGIYIEYDALDPDEAPRGIKSIDWLTYIGRNFAERVGGLDLLKAQLVSKGIDHRSYTNGVLVATGVVPEVNAVKDEIPPELARVNAILRPLRNGSFGSMAFGAWSATPRFTRYLSDLWIRRFDKSGIWPPNLALANTLPKKPVCVAPVKRLKLKPGSPCVEYGRYWLPKLGYKHNDESDDPIAQVVLLPGDTAPYWLDLGPHGEFKGPDAVTWELRCTL